MCQFCGVDPAFAAYFDDPNNNQEQQQQQDATAAASAPVTGEGSNPAPNFFRLKPTNPRYQQAGGRITTQQLTTFNSSLSPNAQVLMGHHGQPYTDALQRWSKCAVKHALAVIKVASAEDVSKTIIMCQSHGLPFVVKCGGHSPSGQSSIENGIVIDLSQLNQVFVKPDEKQIVAGGGALASHVIKAASEYGLACVTGSTSHVGIGGLMLHGGYGYLTGEHGLAVDNILAVEVVTSKGQVVWASKEENEDLFWCIRGAGNKFGVVTKFIIQAHPVSSSVWGGSLVYTGDQLEQVVEAANTWYAKHDIKAAAAIAIGKGADGKAGFTVLPFYDGSEQDAVANFEPFLKLQPAMKDTSSMPYWKINTLCDEPNLYAANPIRFASANIKPPLKVDHLRGALERLDSLYTSEPAASTTGCLILLVQPDGIMKHSRTEMAFSWRDDHFDVGVAAQFTDPALEEKMAKWAQDFGAYLSTAGDSYRLYSNHSDFSGPAARELGINYLQVSKLKQKWDPDNLFPKL
ncbi:FAD-binding domain-containing protein [Lichtheimia hyalospora FSU 10163]|nr:FAD-binding domain-containing protein [Lichtheimia hyalospora FSU 10163]